MNDPPPATAHPASSSMRGSERRFSNTAPRSVGIAEHMSASSRRVNFDEKASAYGSARRKDGSMIRQQSQAQFSPLSESQQSATQSAVTMNHLFAEARREIRRDERREKQHEALPQGDLETGAGGTATEHGEANLTWQSDIQAIQDMLREDWILASMLICIPIGIAAYYTRFGGDSAIFIFNFIAIIPLAWLLGNATEELAMRSNQTIGGLLNATFGNAVELIVSVVALEKGMIKLVQTSLLGSILSNCLLVLGMSFLLGGLKNKVQTYNQKGAHMLSSLLLLASIALVLPAAFVNSFNPHPTMSHLLSISRITALIMFMIYLLYLFFQLYTHSEMFNDEPILTSAQGSSENSSENGDEVKPLPSSANKKRNSNTTIQEPPLGLSGNKTYQGAMVNGNGIGHHNDNGSDEEDEEPVTQISDNLTELADLEDHHGGANSHERNSDTEGDEDDEDDEEDEPSMTFQCALTLLVLVTIAVAICSEFLVDSIESVTRDWGVNESFIGIILIPIVGNAAEHWTAVTCAMKDKMDLAIGVAIGSSTQIALFLIPFITLVGWAIHQPMSLNFSSFETICLAMAVLMVCTLVKSGESNWLQGVMLIAVYGIVATTFWFHPNTTDDVRSQNHGNNWQPQPPQSAHAL